MAPSIIIILTLSVCSLLILAIVIIRKKGNTASSNKNASGLAKKMPMATHEVEEPDNNKAVETKTPENAILSELEDMDMDDIQPWSPENIKNSAELASASRQENEKTQSASTISDDERDHTEDLITLVDRYRFFQGENLDIFSSFMRARDYEGVGRLIQEKFVAQRKENAGREAQEITAKLLEPVLS